MGIRKFTSIQPPPTEKLIFWLVSFLLLSQLAWWISFQVRESARLRDAQIAELRAGRAQALLMDWAALLPGDQGRMDQPVGTLAEYRRLVQGIQSGLPLSAIPLVPLSKGRKAVDIVGSEARFSGIAERKARIEQAFPHVLVAEEAQDAGDPPLLDPGGRTFYLAIRKDVLSRLEEDRQAALWRTGLQASLFAGMSLWGMIYIYRRLNMSLDLMLRQRNFIATVTHELKTPIASLRVWIETLFSRELSDTQKARIEHLMEGDLTRLTTLVGNLLDVARADAGRLEVMPEPVDLGPWLQGVCDGMDLRLGVGGLGLRLEAEPGLWANIDPRLFGAVVENLLSNASKYSAPPRATVVTLEGDDQWVTLSVSDRGFGFHPREAAKLFQRFYRVGDEMTRTVAGTGLGLFLSREIVMRHHGTIRASSLGEGLGATFTVRIPRLSR